MDIISNLWLGLQTAASATNLLYCLIGVFLGTAIGVLPGLGPVATIAMLLPVTFGAAADIGADHAGRHLLRRAIRRLDDGDPRQSAGRVVVGRHGARRLSDGAPGPGRKGARDGSDRRPSSPARSARC